MDGVAVMLASAHLIGWTLVHFVWQGVLLGLLYAAGRAVLPRGEARYRFGMGALMALALSPLPTIWWLLQAAPVVLQQHTTAVMSTASGSQGLPTVAWWDNGLDALLPWLVLAWSLGVILLSLRAWRQWRHLKAMIRVAEAMPLWQQRVVWMAERFGLRRPVTVLCSNAVAAPALVGWLRPVILLPVAVACNFPMAQIELILAHELAHLRRWDPLANLFQVALETIHFYHPVVHWISRDVRNEREICCDSLALAVSGGNPRAFAMALAELGELREGHGAFVLAASGGVLLDRVRLLVSPEPAHARARTSARFAAVTLAALLVAVMFRVEWKQTRLQRDLGASVAQLQSLVTQAWLQPTTPGLASRPPDLILAPMTVRLPVGAPAATGVAAARAQGTMHAPAREPLQVASLPIPDLAIDTGRMSVPVGVRAESATAAIPAPAPAPTPAPILIRQPIYPQDALAHGIEGRVVVEFSLAANGSVRNLHVVSARPGGVFEQAALQAMHGWKYSVPTSSAMLPRYRQTLAFALHATDGGNSPANETEAGDVAVRGGCQVITGTHICRPPDEVAASVQEHPARSDGAGLPANDHPVRRSERTDAVSDATAQGDGIRPQRNAAN